MDTSDNAVPEKQGDIRTLQYKTRGNASPQGRPRVYFCCHREDFERTFAPVTDELTELRWNIAVYYRDPAEKFPENELFFNDLFRMQLFVIPVTWRFLYQENSARNVEMAFALEKGIPVLPLMQESGLEKDFNRICGDLQFLDKAALSRDPTALPYEEKLLKFLDAVLIGEKLAKRVRKAFDAYIFLSYRKKDQLYAQQIMRLIHGNDFCQSVAIWYDEFLTPGENFNDEIKAAIKKSRLMALVVTPNLLEKDNYIHENEYPAAKEMKLAVLPIEARETDAGKLSEMYDGLEACVSAGDPETVRERLHELLRGIALQENDDKPEHIFLMGLAYLSGIDVEVDVDRALRLINSAADAGLPEAYPKLVSMYQTGEKVERNYQTAIEKQKVYVKLLRKTAGEQMTEDNYRSLLNALWELGDYQKNAGDLKSAEKSYLKMRNCARKMSKEGYEVRRSLSVASSNLGEVCMAQGNPDKAKKLYRKALKIDQTLAEETKAAGARRDLFVSCMKLGDVCKSKDHLQEAKKWYRKSLKIRRALADESGDSSVCRDLSTVYNRLGAVSVAEGDLDKAKGWYTQDLEIDLTISDQTGTAEARRDLSVSYEKLGILCTAEGDLAGAKAWYLNMADICRDLADETGTVAARRDFSVCLGRLGNLCAAEEDLTRAKDWINQGLDVRLILAAETGTIEARRDLSVSFIELGDLCLKEEDLKGAKDWYNQALNIRKCLADETGTGKARLDLSVSYNKLGDVSRLEGDLEDAKKWHNMALEISLALAKESSTGKVQRNLSFTYEKLGVISILENDPKSAREWFAQALEITLALTEKMKTMEARRDLSVLYSRYGDICRMEDDPDGAKGWYQEAVKISCSLAEEAGILSIRRNHARFCEILGDICMETGDYKSAADWFTQCLETSRAIFDKTGTIKDRRSLHVIYNKLGGAYMACGGDQTEAADCYLNASQICLELFEKTNLAEIFDDLAVTVFNIGSLSMLPVTTRQDCLRKFVKISELLYKTTGNQRYKEFNRESLQWLQLGQIY